MGNQVSLVPKVSYEDIQMVVYRNTHIPHSTLIINTLPPSLQHCLIKTTVDIQYEEQIVNTMIHKNRDIMIIVYGKNSNDITILHKYEQLVKLGFTNVHIYTGGIFEWMLLYEIYGKDLFKITRYEIDILRYRPKSVLLGAMMGGGGAGAGGYIEDIHRSHDVRINIPASADEDVSNHDTHTPENSNGSLFTGLKWLFS
jgi:rhodanese-related sulfurtransferase